MSKNLRCEALSALHETAEALHEYGIIDTLTMTEFDESCVAPAKEMTAGEIRLLREREQLSRPAFARYLNVSTNTVWDWEQGVQKAGGPALRLLSIIKRKGIGALFV
jgi:Predicted transcriptional regulator